MNTAFQFSAFAGKTASLRHHGKPVEDVGVDSAHLEQMFDLQSFVSLVGVAVTLPPGAYADRVRDCAGVGASAHHSGLSVITGFFLVDLAYGLDQWMVEREVEGGTI